MDVSYTEGDRIIELSTPQDIYDTGPLMPVKRNTVLIVPIFDTYGGYYNDWAI